MPERLIVLQQLPVLDNNFQHIIKQYLRGIRLVLIIDEVHFLKSDALHILRTLSNIEVPEHKLITVLLFGERSFLKKMKVGQRRDKSPVISRVPYFNPVQHTA